MISKMRTRLLSQIDKSLDISMNSALQTIDCTVASGIPTLVSINLHSTQECRVQNTKPYSTVKQQSLTGDQRSCLSQTISLTRHCSPTPVLAHPGGQDTD